MSVSLIAALVIDDRDFNHIANTFLMFQIRNYWVDTRSMLFSWYKPQLNHPNQAHSASAEVCQTSKPDFGPPFIQ